MELKKCPFCGKSILAISKVCKHCGKSLAPIETPPPPQQQPTVPPPPTTFAPPPDTYAQGYRVPHMPSSNSAPKGSSKTIIIVAAAFVVLAALGAIVYKTVLNNSFQNISGNPGNTRQTEQPKQTEQPASPPGENGMNETKADNSDKKEPVQTSFTPQNAFINGTSVTLRQKSSTTSDRVATLNQNEKVQVLDSYYPSNADEAICRSTITLYSSDGINKYILPKGKAVKIISSDGDTYHVSFVHTQYGKMTATVNRSDLENISGEKWYQIRRSSGETGWVFSKYVTLQK